MKKAIGSKEVLSFYHEKCLCKLKWNQNGLLEVSPGFSTEDRIFFDGDSDIFVSPENMESRRNLGCRISSFSFTSPKGALYKYTVELINNRNEEWDNLEGSDLCRVDEEYKAISDKNKFIFSRAKDLSEQLSSANDECLLEVEFVSATNFHPRFANQSSHDGIPIFATYQIVSSNNEHMWSEESRTIDHGNTKNHLMREQATLSLSGVHGQTRTMRGHLFH